MAIYRAGFSVAGVNTANTVLANLKTAAGERARLREVGVSIATAPITAPDLALARMNAAGTGTITSTANAAADFSDSAANAVLETAWATTRPSAVTTYFARMVFPLTVGAGMIWSFPDPIIVPVSAGLVLVNIAASGTTVGQFTGYFVWDE